MHFVLTKTTSPYSPNSLKRPDCSELRTEQIKDQISKLKMEGMQMSNERLKRIKEIRHQEIARHMAIFSNKSLAPKLKESSKRRLIELNVLNERGIFQVGNEALNGCSH